MTRIYIEIESGTVQNVYSRDDVEVVIIDYDESMYFEWMSDNLTDGVEESFNQWMGDRMEEEEGDA